MAIKFEGAYVYQIHEGRKIFRDTVAKQNSGLVIWDGLRIEEVEQILKKMKELQGCDADSRGIQIGNNNTQTNNFG